MNALRDMRTIKQLLTDAERVGRDMGEEEPGAEHLLLAAMGLPDGSASRALGSLGIDADRLRAALLEEQADALVAVGVPRETAERLATPEPLRPDGTPILEGAGRPAREAFRSAGELARSAKQRLSGAHVVAAVATIEKGTVARAIERLGVDRGQLADAAARELGSRA